MNNYILVIVYVFSAISFINAEHTAEQPTMSQTSSTVQPALIGKPVGQQGVSDQHYAHDDTIQHHEMKENIENKVQSVDNPSEVEKEQLVKIQPYTGPKLIEQDFRDIDNDAIERMRKEPQEELIEESIQY